MKQHGEKTDSLNNYLHSQLGTYYSTYQMLVPLSKVGLSL